MGKRTCLGRNVYSVSALHPPGNLMTLAVGLKIGLTAGQGYR